MVYSVVSTNGTVKRSTCAGYIMVPASATFGTADFWIMKHEAKNVNGRALSQAANAPWSSISQTNAISTSEAACDGCRLLSEAEWMTIAANVLGAASNWSGGSIGSGYVFRDATTTRRQARPPRILMTQMDTRELATAEVAVSGELSRYRMEKHLGTWPGMCGNGRDQLLRQVRMLVCPARSTAGTSGPPQSLGEACRLRVGPSALLVRADWGRADPGAARKASGRSAPTMETLTRALSSGVETRRY